MRGEISGGAPAQRLLAEHDRQYSVVAVTDADGAVIERRTFSPYGADPTDPRQGLAGVTDADGYPVHPADQACDVMYTGRHYEPTIGENNHRRRYLQHSRGRWDQADPLGVWPQILTEDTDIERMSSQYLDGASLYCYVGSQPTITFDANGLCKKTLTIKGHGLFDELPEGELRIKKAIGKGECPPSAMTNGLYSDEELSSNDIGSQCPMLCCPATLNLHGCGIGNNEDLMRELASGCTKIKRVCGYIKELLYIPWTEITLPAPWNWKCIDVN